MQSRRLPRPQELAPLMRFRAPTWSTQSGRLEQAHTIYDLRRLAQRRTPRAAFEYADGGAEGEISLRRTRQAFEDIEFHPSVLRDVSAVTTSWDVLGKPSALPFGIAPTGFTRVMHTEGELAGAAAAATAGIPFALSTMGTCTIDDVAAAARAAQPSARTWFQLYLWKDRGRSADLIQRAANVGMDTLIMTVDVPVGGRRLRDVRNGMTVPPTLTLRSALDAVTHPAWWFDFLTTEPLSFAALDRSASRIRELFENMFDPSAVLDDLVWVKDQWPGRLVVKGVQTVEDALRLADAGVDAIVVSNHGGRQLDRTPAPFHLLPDVVSAWSSRTAPPEVWLDSGIMTGADIVAAVALGARFTLIGRAYLYGLMAGGRAGVDRAIAILRTQVEHTLRLLGVQRLEDLGPQHVTQLGRLKQHHGLSREPFAATPAPGSGRLC
jgi:L-lactate dehydrogenase (cytochrome)